MRVDILAYEGCLASELFAFRDLLAMANHMPAAAGGDGLQVIIRTVGDHRVRTSGGAWIDPNHQEPDGDLLIVPGFDFVSLADIDQVLGRLAAEVDYLARRGRASAVGSICVGAFLLGAAGLLDGRRATTAWAFGEELGRRWPACQVDTAPMLIEERGLVTCGAFSAAQDLALHLIERALGAEVARQTRNLALIEGGRSSQAPFHDPDLLPSRAQPFADRVESWLAERLASSYSLPALSDALGASSRTVLRRYKAERSRTPLEYLQRIRIARAKQLLETTGLSIPEVAHRVGYQDISAFRELFARLAGATPGAHRRRFSRMAAQAL